MTALSPHDRVAVVLVTHNSAGVIEDALNSIPDGCEIVVVDNASSDETVRRLSGYDVKLTTSDENLGFGKACNLGAAATTREFIFFLNPDATLDGEAVVKLVAAADAHPQAAAFNPKILRRDGSQFFRVRSHLFPETRRAKKITPEGDQNINVLSGAACLVRREAFEAVGGFDPNIFLYCEDDDLGLRFLKTGATLRYVQDAVVRHTGNASSEPSPDLERFKAYHEMRSRWYTSQKHGVRFSRVGQTAQSVINWLAAAVRFDAKAKRKHAGRLKALLEPPPTISN